MPSTVFQRIDRRYFAQAISTFMTHGSMDLYESGLEFSSQTVSGRNKDQRAAAIVDHLFASTDTDRLIEQLLDYLFVDPPWSADLMQTDGFASLDMNVLIPRGVVLTGDGYRVGEGATPAPVAGPPGVAVISAPVAEPAKPKDMSNRSIFVVHGRDERPVEVLDTFLTFCGLEMMAWSDAVRHTGKSQPTTYEIVHAGIANAAAVIVIFSPDDAGRVKDAYAASVDDPDKVPRGQARQNVVLEAGLAFGLAPDRTIFVQSEPTRPMSDLDGFNWVKLDGLYDSRKDLINRLGAHATLRHKDNLMDRTAGPFQVV